MIEYFNIANTLKKEQHIINFSSLNFLFNGEILKVSNKSLDIKNNTPSIIVLSKTTLSNDEKDFIKKVISTFKLELKVLQSIGFEIFDGSKKNLESKIIIYIGIDKNGKEQNNIVDIDLLNEIEITIPSVSIIEKNSEYKTQLWNLIKSKINKQS